MTGSHHLSNTRCNNCSLNAFAFFPRPAPNGNSWFGGCGNIFCTGMNNYLIHDWDGDFLGQPGILLANNSVIGDNSYRCTKIDEMNGHHCQRTDMGVLQYESIAPDFNTRIMWPVYLHYDGAAYTTETNAWR